MQDKLILNLGCGDKKLKGFVNVDIIKDPDIKYYDLNKYPLPWKDNTVDYVHCEHLLYYLDNPADFLHEVYRISKNNSRVKLIVTHFSLPMAHAELRTKKVGYSYYMLGHPGFNREFLGKFKVIRKKINFTRYNYKFLNIIFNPFINTFPMFYERFLCYILPASEIIFDLKVTKN